MKISREEIIAKLEATDKLPAINPEISDIIRLVNNEDTLNLEELSDKIMKCGNLKKALLENINSGYFNITRKIESIKEAIVFLGMRTVEKLIVAYLIKYLLPNTLGNASDIDNKKYWNHCLGTAIAANIIAEKIGIEDKYRYFAYGLIHDIGYTILDICFPEIIEEAFNIQKKGISQVVAERIVMQGCTHADIGAWICDKWGLHDDIKTIVEHHHTPLTAKSYNLEARIMNIADGISTLYYEKILNVSTSFAINENIVKTLGIKMDFIEEISLLLPKKVEEGSEQLNFNMIDFQ